jgi:hypothetical protein
MGWTRSEAGDILTAREQLPLFTYALHFHFDLARTEVNT